MLAPWAAIRAVTAATALASSGAPSSTGHPAGAAWGVVAGAGLEADVEVEGPGDGDGLLRRSSSPSEGANSIASVRWPRTTTCSTSRTSAPTSAMASKSALLTPGRSSPLTVTRRVGAPAVRGSSTAQRYRAVQAAPRGVSPCDQVADGPMSYRGPSAHGEQPRARGIQPLGSGGVVARILGEAARPRRDACRALDLVGVPPDRAPLVEDPVLVRDGVGVANPCQMSACSATMRRVLRSPPPRRARGCRGSAAG